MNPDTPQTPQEQIEARLTALLLGELTPHEAASLHEAIQNDARLGELYARLKETIALVRETAASPAGQTAAQPAPLKLSEDRRQKLLAQFKTVEPREFVEARESEKSSFSPLLAAAAVLALMAMLAGLLLPSLSKAKLRSQKAQYIANRKVGLAGAGPASPPDDRISLSGQMSNSGVPGPGSNRVYSMTVVGYHQVPTNGLVLIEDQPNERKISESLARSKGANDQNKAGEPPVMESGKSVIPLRTLNSTITADALTPPSASAPKRTEIFLPASNELADATREPDRKPAFDLSADSTDQNKLAYALNPRTFLGADAADFTNGAQRSDNSSSFDNLGTVQTPALVSGDVAGNSNLHLFRDLNGNTNAIGDPQWVGILDHPETRRSDSNQFVARYAFSGDIKNGLDIQNKEVAPPPPASVPSSVIDPNTGLPVAAPGGNGQIKAFSVPLANADPKDVKSVLQDLYPNDNLVGNNNAPLAQRSQTVSQNQLTTPSGGGGGFAGGASGGLGGTGGRGASGAGGSGIADGSVQQFRAGSGISAPATANYILFPNPGASDVAAPTTPGTIKNGQVSNGMVLSAGTQPSVTTGQPIFLTVAGTQGSPGGTPVFYSDSSSKLALEQVEKSWDAGLGNPRSGIADKGLADGANAATSVAHGTANIGKSGELALNRRHAGEEEGKVPTLGDLPPVGALFAASEPAKRARNDPLITRQGTVGQNQLTGGGIGFGDRGGGALGTANSTRDYPNSAMPAPTSVSIDPDTKSIVVMTDDKTMAKIGETIAALDKKAETPPANRESVTVANGIVLPQMAMSDEQKKTSTEERFGNSVLTWKSDTLAKTPPQQESEKVVAGSTMTLARNIAAPTVAPEKPREALMEERSAEVTASNGQLTRQLKDADSPLPHPAVPPPVPQPEVQSRDNAFSTFSLNVSDVSFKLAGASLEKGVMPEPATIRSEEFINAFDYRDPEPPPGARIGFAWERSQYPFAHNRDLLRFSVKTAAAGREPGRPLNIVLLLDNSGSMERADRVQIIHEALRVLASQLQPQDTLSVVTFARTARLWVDGVPGSQAGDVAEKVGGLTPQGGTNLEEAMRLAYATALRHYLANGINRVVLLTDGAANLGNVNPEALKQKVEANRKQGIALDCFGIGWEGYNDDLLEVLSRNGDGRYGFLNTPEEAATGFAGQLAGALHVAAADVKVQVEFNPKRVAAYRQLGYAKHQLTKQQFRDNSVDAAEIGAAESGNALYVIQVNPQGDGPLATVRVRYKIPNTTEYREQAWPVPYTGTCASLDKASPAMRLSATASAFSEWLASSPYAAEVSPDQLLGYLSGVPEVYGVDARPKKLEWMVRQAKSISGK